MEVDCPPFVKLEALTCSGDSKGSYLVHPRLLAGRKLAPCCVLNFTFMFVWLTYAVELLSANNILNDKLKAL